MTSTKSTSEAFGFADVEDACEAVLDGIESGSWWQRFKGAVQRLAVFKRRECQGV